MKEIKKSLKPTWVKCKEVHTINLLRSFETGKWLWFLKSKIKYLPTL